MICPHKGKINNIFNKQKWGKNDPPNISCDEIGTYLEIANCMLLFVSRTLFSLAGFPLPTSSLQLQSSGQDLAVRGSEDLLCEDFQTIHRATFVTWGFSSTLCQNVLNTCAKSPACFSSQDLYPIDS